MTRWQKKDQSIASFTDQNAALSKQLEEFSKVSKELDEERASTSQLKEQHSLELAKQRTKLEDACKHYQNTLKDEQGKLQLREEELGAANSEISRIKSEVAAKTDAVAAHELKVKALSQDVERLEVTTVWEVALGFTNAIDARRWESNSYSISRIGKSEAMTKKCCIKVCSSITATKTRSIVYCCHSK